MSSTSVAIETQVDEEQALVAKAQAGDVKAFERLIRLHQPWVFNIILRMVADYHLAEDVSQEVLVKIYCKLSTFKGKSRFRTWLYRVAVNQVLAVKKIRQEEYREKYSRRRVENKFVEVRLTDGIPDQKLVSAEIAAIAREAMVKCLLGMLLCLNRKQRIVYIVGSILNVNSRTGSRIASVSEANFRQILSRTKKRLRCYMSDRCGLINPAGPCRCGRSASADARSGSVDPLRWIFNAAGVPKIREIISRAQKNLHNLQYTQCRALYRDHPFQDAPDFSAKVIEILNSEDCRKLLDLAPHSLS